MSYFQKINKLAWTRKTRGLKRTKFLQNKRLLAYNDKVGLKEKILTTVKLNEFDSEFVKNRESNCEHNERKENAEGAIRDPHIQKNTDSSDKQ